MKGKLTSFLIFLGIGFLVYFLFVRPEYRWAFNNIEKKTKEGWILIDSSKSGSFVKPWTLFITPTTNLWFIKKDEISRLDSCTMLGHIFYARNNGDGSAESESYDIYNCSEKKYYSLRSIEEINTYHSSKTIWFKIEKNSEAFNICNFLCSLNKKYTMLDVLGREVDISNYIISGRYSKVDSSNYIFSIINNNPYIPSELDENPIHDAIIKWLTHNYPNQNFSLPKNLYKITSYKTSFIEMYIPADIYSVEVVPNITIGKMEFEFFFTRQGLPKEYYNPDYKIAILNENN